MIPRLPCLVFALACAAIPAPAAKISLASGGTVSAQDAFGLHDTYGFPIDLTSVMAEERGLKVDVAGYEALMVTTDTHMFPKRERDRRNGIGLNLKKTPANIAAVMARRARTASELSAWLRPRNSSVLSARQKLRAAALAQRLRWACWSLPWARPCSAREVDQAATEALSQRSLPQPHPPSS